MKTWTFAAGFLAVISVVAVWRAAKRWTTGNNPAMLALIEPFISDEGEDFEGAPFTAEGVPLTAESAFVAASQPGPAPAQTRARSAAGHTV
jgi:hypothetical protein